MAAPASVEMSQAVDLAQLSREMLAAQVALADAERAATRDEERAKSSRADVAARRLGLGRLLVQARGCWPRSGPKARGWGEFLERQGIDQDAALRYMALAGYVTEVSRTDDDVRETVPTYREAGIDKRPRKSKSDEDAPADDWQREVESRRRPAAQEEEPSIFSSWANDISKALVGLDKMIMGYAKKWPRRSRTDLAKTLRSVAERIERMPGD